MAESFKRLWCCRGRLNAPLRFLGGVGGLGFNFVATRQYGRAELYIERGDKAENDYVFQHLIERRDEIENAFGDTLVWEPLEERRACRIKAEQAGNVFERDQWDAMVNFMVDVMCRLELAIKGPLREVWTNRSMGAGGIL
jgi:hypothetical protein